MGWNSNDGKCYQGKLFKVFVSLNESLEIEDYIDHFLRTRGYELTEANRKKIAKKLEHIADRSHHALSELDHWLDIQFSG